MNKKYIKKISDYSIAGSLSVLVILSLQGCETKNEETNNLETFQEIANKNTNHLIVLKEGSDGKYKIENEFPSEKNLAIIKDKNGEEKLLNEEEIKKETSTNSNLGSTLGASILGSAIGYWTMNNLLNNNIRKNYYSNPSVYDRSINLYNSKKEEEEKKRIGGGYIGSSAASSYNSSNSKSSTKSSGFFNSSGKSSSSSFSFGG